MRDASPWEGPGVGREGRDGRDVDAQVEPVARAASGSDIGLVRGGSPSHCCKRSPAGQRPFPKAVFDLI